MADHPTRTLADLKDLAQTVAPEVVGNVDTRTSTSRPLIAA